MFEEEKIYDWTQISPDKIICVDIYQNLVATLFKHKWGHWLAGLSEHPYGWVIVDEIFHEPKLAAKAAENALNNDGTMLRLWQSK